jgi:hypothetical protein
LQELLLKGDRVAAIRHAMNENLWSHALIIASCVNKDLWKEVVTEFVKHEMGTQKGDTFESNGRESWSRTRRRYVNYNVIFRKNISLIIFLK